MTKKDFYTSSLWKNGVKFFSELNKFIEKFPSSERNVLGVQIKSSMATILADLAEADACAFYDAKKKILVNAHGRIERIKCYLRISVESGSVDKAEAEKISKKFDDIKKEINRQFQLKIPGVRSATETKMNSYLKEVTEIIKNKKGGITFAEIRDVLKEKRLKVHERTLRRYISKLYSGNLIYKIGRGKSTYYQNIEELY